MDHLLADRDQGQIYRPIHFQHHRELGTTGDTEFMYFLRLRGLVKISRERPLIHHPLVSLFQVFFPGLDFLRRPYARLSQMVFVLKRAEPG
ncbi:MAG: hypothetical protein JO366_00360 [Methylobacteriaceae bacterium]|nr:hypothetical protein [Methylobacteriaceae bacterium]MBV9243244.1 hypothetical protein [Methylobacteriaceae bacterium]MBV9635555.1 hypothetical protein [Methylobacteriaceae bacterium]MBV9702403.1 hypothetical protein [Methylobacteriaceae bacterium]